MDRKQFVLDSMKMLREQGKYSISETRQCLYRGPGGTKCLIGFHIPDEVYKPSFEHGSLSSIMEKIEVRAPLEAKYGPIEPEDMKFLRACQTYLHDEVAANTWIYSDGEALEKLEDYLESKPTEVVN